MPAVDGVYRLGHHGGHLYPTGDVYPAEDEYSPGEAVVAFEAFRIRVTNIDTTTLIGGAAIEDELEITSADGADDVRLRLNAPTGQEAYITWEEASVEQWRVSVDFGVADIWELQLSGTPVISVPTSGVVVVDRGITANGVITGSTIVGVNVTSGNDPGHTHTIVSGAGWTDDGVVVRLTTSSDRVAIGTVDPATELHVIGTIRTDDFELSIAAATNIDQAWSEVV